MPDFKVVSDFQPTGDQPQAIDKIADGRNQDLLFIIDWDNDGNGCHDDTYVI